MRSAHIAILDDDDSVRTAITRLLKAAGLAAKAHPNFNAFRSSLDDEYPDCLVLDLHMPDVDGMEVMRYLRRESINLPIIMISAHDEVDVRNACFGLGALSYLTKPLDAEKLLLAIENATSAARAE